MTACLKGEIGLIQEFTEEKFLQTEEEKNEKKDK